MSDFIKSHRGAPAGFFAAEAAGLEWLAAPGAVPVVSVLDVGPDRLVLQRLASAAPDAQAARTFGAGLRRLHDAGAAGFGWAPSEKLWFGPLDAPFEVATTPRQSFAEFWAADRLQPMRQATASSFDPSGLQQIDAAIAAVGSGAFDGISGGAAEPVSRVHGDLWSGNLMFTPGGGTLIDPSAHGGHRLEDLALLSLFGAPYLDDIYAGYESQQPLPAGWQQDLPAHLFFALLAHVHLFGSAYVPGALRTAESITSRARELGHR